MKDQSRTKQSLIEEMTTLRKRVADMERVESGSKRAEEVLWAASRYARNLIEASLDPLVTISAEGKITDVNTAT